MNILKFENMKFTLHAILDLTNVKLSTTFIKQLGQLSWWIDGALELTSLSPV